MKLRRKHTINYAEADQLIERYYDGLTSGEEENQLRTFLSQNNLPERYRTEQDIFGYFSNKKVKRTFSIQPYIRWASAAAVVLIAMVSVHLFSMKNNQSFAYIDGQRITDVHAIKSQALASLSDVSTGNVEIENGINDLNNHLPEQELNVFAGLEQ